MEWLEAASAYVRNPISGGLNELLNQWEDWSGAAPTLGSFPPPVYTQNEAELLVEVALNWEAFCNATSQDISKEHEALQLPEWRALIQASRRALDAMQHRGRLSETSEDD
jgi:hypothetical protein